jgi:hypothetical protein
VRVSVRGFVGVSRAAAPARAINAPDGARTIMLPGNGGGECVGGKK